MWPAVAMVAIQVVGSIFGNKAQKQAAKNQQIIDDANAKASNMVREGNNELRAKQSSLASYMSSLNNQNTLKVAGQQVNSIGENLVRSLNNSAAGNIQQRLQNAEQAGALLASASAAGIGGSNVNQIQGAMALRNASAQQIAQVAEDYAVSDTMRQSNAVMTNASRQLDYNMSFANIDYNVDQAPIRAGAPSMGSAILGGLQNSMPALNTIASSMFAPSAAPSAIKLGTEGDAGGVLKSANPQASNAFMSGLNSATQTIQNFFKPTGAGVNLKL